MKESQPTIKCNVPQCDRTHKTKSLADIHELHEKYYGPGANRRQFMSTKKLAESGKDVNKEIEKLLAEKEKAKKSGNREESRKIRRQLRKLGYKRAIAKGDVEVPKKAKAEKKEKAPKKIESKKKVAAKKVSANEEDEQATV